MCTRQVMSVYADIDFHLHFADSTASLPRLSPHLENPSLSSICYFMFLPW
jgi:hypothetical protein